MLTHALLNEENYKSVTGVQALTGLAEIILFSQKKTACECQATTDFLLNLGELPAGKLYSLCTTYV
jgi:hypothetical protein